MIEKHEPVGPDTSETATQPRFKWWLFAACRGDEPGDLTDIFFSDSKKEIERAKGICETCQVKDACLESAMSDLVTLSRVRKSSDDHGVFAGTTPTERADLLRLIDAQFCHGTVVQFPRRSA